MPCTLVPYTRVHENGIMYNISLHPYIDIDVVFESHVIGEENWAREVKHTTNILQARFKLS